jgi:acyl carrier protein
MSNVSLTHDDLIAFIRDGLNIDTPIDAETELFSTGLLDSVSMVSLIGYIEEKVRITVQPGDVTLENFDSVQRIADYVRSLG